MDLIRCTRCVKQVPPESRFCRRCGCSIRSQPRSLAAPARITRTEPQPASKAGGFVVAAFVAIAVPIVLTAFVGRSAKPQPRIEYVPFTTGSSATTYERAVPSSTVIIPRRSAVTQPPPIVQPPQYNHPYPPGFDKSGRWVGFDAAGRTMVRPGEPQLPAHVSPYHSPAYGSRPAGSQGANPGSSNRR